MHTIQREARLVVLDLDGALVIDATGLVNLQSLLDRLKKSRVVVVLTGIHVRLVGPFERAGIVADDVHLFVRDDIPAGLALANELLARGK